MFLRSNVDLQLDQGDANAELLDEKRKKLEEKKIAAERRSSSNDVESTFDFSPHSLCLFTRPETFLVHGCKIGKCQIYRRLLCL